MLHHSAAGGGLEEDEPVLADLDLVATDEHLPVDTATVDVAAVEAARVDELPAAVGHVQLGVPTRHRDVVEEQLALGRASDDDRGRRGVEVEARALLRSAQDDEHRLTDAEPAHAGRVHRRHGCRVALGRGAQPQDPGLRGHVLDLGQRLERGPAGGAEVVVLVGEMVAPRALAVHGAPPDVALDPESRLSTTLRTARAGVNGAEVLTCGQG